MPLFGEPARVEQAVGYYRERFDVEGWREHTVYPQVEDTLRTLHGRATAWRWSRKNERMRAASCPPAVRRAVREIVGSTLDGSRSHKPELVGEALRRLQVQPAQCWMIGDRRMDIEARATTACAGRAVGLWR